MEEVTHRVHEDHPGNAPTQREIQPFRPQLEVKTLLIGVGGDTSPPLRKSLRIAVSAS
jgi:hypothetical protein